jgi:hypothetical protein
MSCRLFDVYWRCRHLGVRLGALHLTVCPALFRPPLRLWWHRGPGILNVRVLGVGLTWRT